MKRDKDNTRDFLLCQCPIKINGNTAPTLHLCSVLEYITFKKDKTSVIKVEDVSSSLYLNTNSEQFKTFHDLLDNICKMGISKTYGKYNCMHESIVCESNIVRIESEYIKHFAMQHGAILSMLNANEKQNKYKGRQHLVHFYNKLSLWNFVSILRCRNNKLFPHWVIILQAAKYGSRASSYALATVSLRLRF